jgi:2'-5' RNA ligase
MVRAFISVDFDDESIRKNIVSIQTKINSSGAHLRLVNPSILHITLEFLGEISQDKIKEIKEILDKIEFPKLKLEVKEPNVLPSENYIKVVYCELEGDIEPLKQIQTEIRLKLKEKDFRVDKRPFKPHLTIARVKSKKNREELIDVIKELSEIHCGIQEIMSLKLKKSVLKLEGPEYSTLHEVNASLKGD